MTKHAKTITIALSLIFAPVPALAHSGGTDSAGCHAGTQPYHCHNDKEEDELDSDTLLLITGVAVLGVTVLYLATKNGDSYANPFYPEPPERNSLTPTITYVGEDEDEATEGHLAIGFKYSF